MTDLFQIAALIVLVLVWFSVRKTSTRIAEQTASIIACFNRLDVRLEDIETRLRDSFKTDTERQAEVDRQP